MRKDIEIPKAENAHIVAVQEWDKEFTNQQWNIYVVNNREDEITTVLVLSRGKSEDQKTSTLRHGLGNIKPKTASKVEFKFWVLPMNIYSHFLPKINFLNESLPLNPTVFLKKM